MTDTSKYNSKRSSTQYASENLEDSHHQGQGQIIYMTNLDYSIDEQKMMLYLRDKGFNPQKAKLLYNQDGRSKGCGFVEMSSNSEASRAIKQLNSTSFEGRQVTIRMANNQAA